MSIKKFITYLYPLLLAVLIFLSDFLDTNLFQFDEHNFAVWFVLSVFCFAVGWLVNKSFGWRFGGKIIFALTSATSIFSVFLITFFREYFQASDIIAENIILFILRNVVLGTMGFFGMSVSEIFILQRENLSTSEKLKIIEETIKDAKKESELTIKDAQLKAKQILLDAEITTKNLLLKKDRIEKELKEFIQIEKELIKKYEEQG